MVMAKIAAFAFGFFAFLLANLVRCFPAQSRILFAGALGWTPYPLDDRRNNRVRQYWDNFRQEEILSTGEKILYSSP